MSELGTAAVKGAEKFVQKGAEVLQKVPEIAKKGIETVGKPVKESARRMSERIRSGRNPDNVLKELSSMPANKSELSRNRMQPPMRVREDKDERHRRQNSIPNSDSAGATQIGLINIHG